MIRGRFPQKSEKQAVAGSVSEPVEPERLEQRPQEYIPAVQLIDG